MSTLDFRDMSATMRHMINGLAERKISGPLHVAKDGEPVAVIIRSQAYAPRLHHFQTSEEGWPVCHACPEPAIIGPRALNLAEALDYANAHWADTHQPRAIDIPKPHDSAHDQNNHDAYTL